MIEIKNITKSYDEVLSLCDVSATIGSGSIYGLIGSNGAGKSCLRLMPEALRATNSLSEFMRKKVRNTESMAAMGMIRNRNIGLK